MTGVETIGRIRFEHFQNGKAIKRIARELAIARDTVRKVLRSGATKFICKREVQPRRKLGAWVDTLTAILEAEDRLPRPERRSRITATSSRPGTRVGASRTAPERSRDLRELDAEIAPAQQPWPAQPGRSRHVGASFRGLAFTAIREAALQRDLTDSLSAGDRQDFLTRYLPRVSAAYAAEPDGKVLPRFPRLLILARKL